METVGGYLEAPHPSMTSRDLTSREARGSGSVEPDHYLFFAALSI